MFPRNVGNVLPDYTWSHPERRYNLCSHLRENLKFNTNTKIIFRDMTPCSLLSVNRRFGGTYRLHLQGRRNKFSKKPARKQVPSRALVSCSAYSSTLKMEAIFLSEMSVDSQRTTRRHIPEDDTLHNHRCENLKILTGICLHLPGIEYRFSGHPSSAYASQYIDCEAGILELSTLYSCVELIPLSEITP
jgi:hypothetical protein